MASLGLPLTASFRQRAQVTDRASKQASSERRKIAAKKMHEQLQHFEDKLNEKQEAYLRAMADIPDEAPSRNQRLRAVSPERNRVAAAKSSQHQSQMVQNQSEPDLREMYATMGNLKKPPSPLQFYDYGCVSLKPRSAFAQHLHQGESARPAHRQTSCGFYYPGSSTRYGFSMMDPVLLPARIGSKTSPDAPARWLGDAADTRPQHAESIALWRKRIGNAEHISSTVRNTKTHSLRAAQQSHTLDKNREEAVIEQVRFESGVYDGRWRDPVLDGFSPQPHPSHEWVNLPRSQMSDVQREALALVLGLDSAVRSSRGSLNHLFAAENGGAKGALELDEFKRGLIRLNIIAERKLGSDQELAQMLATLDPGYDGRVKLPILARVIATWRAKHPLSEEPQTRATRQRVSSNIYGDQHKELDSVKVAAHDKGTIKDFQTTFDRFRRQQNALLTYHTEV